jgi:hypothetical protein
MHKRVGPHLNTTQVMLRTLDPENAWLMLSKTITSERFPSQIFIVSAFHGAQGPVYEQTFENYNSCRDSNKNVLNQLACTNTQACIRLEDATL